MGIYDYIIIGGGISGLFIAHKLADTEKDILIVESTNRLGGRLFTKNENNLQFELGGARISSQHKKVMSLLTEFNLIDDLIELPDKINYKIKGPKINFYSLIKDLTNGTKLYTKKYLETINLLQLCIDILGQPYAKLLQNMLGYDSEFEKLNSYMAIKTFSKDLFSSSKYFILKNGFSSLIDLIHKNIESKTNIKIKLNTNVSDIGKNFIMIDKKKIYGSKIICCIPYDSIKRFPKFKFIDEIHSVSSIPLIRIYAKYPKDKNGKVWFHGLKRTITDSYIRHIIPIDYESGLIMISYTDGQYADMWNNLSKLGNKQLITHLHKEIKLIFNKDIPNPEYITSHYWSGGVHMWKPGQNIKHTYQKLLKLFEDEQIYIANEAYSLHQSWVEGSLDMCYDILELLDHKFTRNKPKKIKGGDPKTKYFTIQQVLKHRNWIIMDIKKKLRIYDVHKWLKDHPGGKDNLKKGIKANKYYLDSKKYPISPIKLFRGIGAHMNSNVIKKMLLTPNDKVKYIGLLKKV